MTLYLMGLYLQRALREAWIPALAMVTVCCSITSWIATRS